MSRPQSAHSSVPPPSESRGVGMNSTAADFAQGNPTLSSPLAQSMSTAPHDTLLAGGAPTAAAAGGNTFYDAPQVASEDGATGVDRATSTATTAVQASAPSRSNTLKKRGSVRRADSLKRSSSKRSLKAGSLAGLGGGSADGNAEYNSYATTPIPTAGSPTEILANRFQAWRQLLKSLIAYFREIQASYEVRAKATHKVQNVIASISNPSVFVSQQGLGEATRILDEYHKRSIAEANKSREIEEDVIGALTGLRSDLGQKIKEIKSLSGDFKNSVDKEQETTRKEVEKLQESIQLSERDDGSAMGKNDPFVVKLGVDRAVERQIDEENYLHRAYLNLESSGRELESIVVGEIQKAYNALAGILKREGDDAYNTLDLLRSGPISMPKDAEWMAFVDKDSHFVDPHVPLRRIEDIEYPGKHHPSAVEVRAGMLERKSKYLKSYTPGWYVLSPTHLHEFKSADKIYSQPPVMSLYLPDQKLGSHSQPGSSSHKFMVKGKQSGNMHKGHNWVFRAETYDTMLAWFEDMNTLTEKRGEERNAFVRKHARSYSSASRRASVSSDGMEEDEADQVPYSADVSSLPSATQETRPPRPLPGGRFPSDLQIPRERAVSEGQSSNASSNHDSTTMAGALLPGSNQLSYAQYGKDPYRLEGVTAGTATASSYHWEDAKVRGSYFGSPRFSSVDEGDVPQQQEAFAGHEPANPDGVHPLATDASSAEQRAVPVVQAAPVATIVQSVEVAAPGSEALTDQRLPSVSSPVPEIPEKSSRRSSPSGEISTEVIAADGTDISQDIGASGASGVEEVGVLPITTSTSLPAAVQPASANTADAHEARPSPRSTRHDTGMSISQLPIPGKFPKDG